LTVRNHDHVIPNNYFWHDLSGSKVQFRRQQDRLRSTSQVGAEMFLDQSWHKIRDRTGASKAANKRQLDGTKQFITVYNFSFDMKKAPEGA
jgi:hypothetical protein